MEGRVLEATWNCISQSPADFATAVAAALVVPFASEHEGPTSSDDTVLRNARRPSLMMILIDFPDDSHQRDARHSHSPVLTEEPQRLRVEFVLNSSTQVVNLKINQANCCRRQKLPGAPCPIRRASRSATIAELSLSTRPPWLFFLGEPASSRTHNTQAAGPKPLPRLAPSKDSTTGRAFL